MRFLVTGATGFIGRHLCAEILRRGDTVRIVTRDPDRARAVLPGIEAMGWDAVREPLPVAATVGADACIHLLGDPVAEGRWTRKKKERIRESRVIGTRNLVAGLWPIPVLVSGSAIGFYGDRGDETLAENARAGSDFLAGVCREWETEATIAKARVALVRTGIVLGRGGGALEKMLTPFRFWMGGPIGGGRQWMSWIHIDDMVAMLLHATTLEGPVNGVAPNPVTNREFATTLGRVMGKPSFMPTPRLMLRIALGQVVEVLCGSQRCVPRRAIDSGFAYKFPDLEPALRNLIE